MAEPGAAAFSGFGDGFHPGEGGTLSEPGRLLPMTIRRIIGMIMLVAALTFGAADLRHTYVPYGDSQLAIMGRLWLLISARSMTSSNR